jgi:hypothetical protein
VRCLTQVLQDKDVTGKYYRSVAETHTNQDEDYSHVETVVHFEVIRINFGLIRPKTHPNAFVLYPGVAY